MSEDSKLQEINSPDSFWILLKGKRKKYCQLVVDSKKNKTC